MGQLAGQVLGFEQLPLELLFGGPGTMFPNMSPLARQPRTLAVWHPRGPHQTEVWRWYFVDADDRVQARAAFTTAVEVYTALGAAAVAAGRATVSL